MDDAHGVHVGEALGQRNDDLEGLLFRQDGPAADVLVQLAPADQLHYDIQILGVTSEKRMYLCGLEGLDERDNALVVN